MDGSANSPLYYSLFIVHFLFYVNPSAALVPLKREQTWFLGGNCYHTTRTHAVRPYEPEKLTHCLSVMRKLLTPNS